MEFFANPLIVCIFLLILMYVIQLAFNRYFYQTWLLVTASPIWAVRMYSLLMLPGTIIHELSHWLTAEILQVPTGKFNFIPVIENSSIKMGSLQIAHTDPFRRTIIGLAPFFTGLCIVLACLYFIPLDRSINLSRVFIIWVVFVITNTMFPSPKDLEQVLVPIIFLIFFIYVWWRIDNLNLINFINSSYPYITKLNSVLIIVISINAVLLCSSKILTIVSGKVFHRRIVHKYMK